MVTNHHQEGPGIILPVELQSQMVSYTSGHQGDKMTLLIIILTLLFVLGSISPLLVTEDMQDIVRMEES
jgi:hypothetical protein